MNLQNKTVRKRAIQVLSCYCLFLSLHSNVNLPFSIFTFGAKRLSKTAPITIPNINVIILFWGLKNKPFS